MIWVFAAVGAVILYLTSKTPAPMNQTVEAVVNDAIAKGIVKPLGLPDVSGVILRIQSKLETRRTKPTPGTGWDSTTFLATNSLFNRHAGSGKGEWKGSGLPRSAWKLGVHLYYAKPGDEDLRIFTDVYQSARDMAQLLQDPLYRAALAELRRGNGPGYYNELRAAGFAADPFYASTLNKMYAAEVA